MLVVFDSNVVIPLIVPNSASHRLYRQLIERGHRVFVSRQTLTEIADKLLHKRKLRDWHKQSDESIAQFLQDLPELFEIAPGILTASGSVPRDSRDEHVVAAALECGADYIVTQDRHLLDLGLIEGVTILTREELTSLLEGGASRPAAD